MGIKSVLIVSGRGHAGDFLELLAGGSQFGMQLAYEIQEEAGGIAQALSLAEPFVGNESMCVMLADNVFEDDLSEAIDDFEKGSKEAHVFLKTVAEPQHYGVVRFDGNDIVEIVEKPSQPPSDLAVTGCYLYKPGVFEFIHGLEPSARGELEITDVNDHYVKNGSLSFSELKGFWGDCGESIDTLMEVSQQVKKLGL